MMLGNRNICGIAFVCCALWSVAHSQRASAAEYPTRSVTLLVASAPGGAVDAIARIIADAMRGRLNQSVVVENRPGAGGFIGIQAAAQAKPDGYTLLVNNSGYSVGPLFQKSFTIDPVNDLTHIVTMGNVHLYLLTNSQAPFKTGQELVAFAKKNPGKLNWGYQSITYRMDSVLVQKALGIEIMEISYAASGAADISAALLRNDIQLMENSWTTSAGHIKQGNFRPLAFYSSTRSRLAPDVPTFAEAFPNTPMPPQQAVIGLSGPRNLPPEIVERLNAAINEILKDPATVKRLLDIGVEPVGGTPDAWKATQRDVFDVYKKTAQALHIEPQ